MSGYLEVKYPFKSNLGLNPFKSWKRQWCILRPSPTFTGGILAVYCSEAGAAAGTIELPSGFVVRRAKSRTRPHAFAVFPTDEPRKPRVLLAASTTHDAQMWMEKIKILINGNKLLDSESSLKNSFSVTVTGTQLSRKCGLNGADSTVSVTSDGVLVSHSQRPGVFVQWKYIIDASLTTENGGRSGTCILTVDSGFIHGSGALHFDSPLASSLTRALRRSLGRGGGAGLGPRALSKSDGELNKSTCSDVELGEVRRSSWYSGPSEVSLDDLDLVMSKDRAGAARALTRRAALAARDTLASDHSMSDRRSLASVASGIYEEIPDLPAGTTGVTGTTGASGPTGTTGPTGTGPDPTPEDSVYCKMTRDRPPGMMTLPRCLPEPTYECVQECVYATLRRTRRPPPLPPRPKPHSPPCRVARAGSLGSLPAPPAPRTLPRWDRPRHAFSAFRKRLKSDSRSGTSPKSETPKEKDVENKKKKFEFTPSRDLFKSFKVSRKNKNLKTAGALTKGETKSCEFLDDTELVKPNRCSKSVESLEGNDEYLDDFDADLSIEFDDHTVAALSLPQEIVNLILKGHEKLNQLCVKDESEGDYMPMSPIVPPPMEHHYIVMSPRTNMA